MKKSVCIITGFILLSCSQLLGQKFTAAIYWKMENDSSYASLLKRQKAGDVLSQEDKASLTDYQAKLGAYFEKLPDSEKAKYYQNRAGWTANPALVDKPVRHEDIYAGERSMYSRYLISSGIFGFWYGITADYIFDVTDAGLATAIPLITAGASTLVPVLSLKDRNITYNALALSIHGRSTGGLQGIALGFLIMGNSENDGKVILGLSTLSSIGLGRLGFYLGMNKPWTEGRAALYTHYGTLMPLEGIALDAAFQADDARIYGLTSLVFGAGGYLIADVVAKRNDFTRGDVSAISTLSTVNGLFGLAVIADIAGDSDIRPGHFLLPAFAALGGTIAGQLWMKDARLTGQQGRNIGMATTGGILIGCGLAAIFNPDHSTPYYISGYAGGMASYAILACIYRNSNKTAWLDPAWHSRWNVTLMPQNLMINKKLSANLNSNPGKGIWLLPAFSVRRIF